MNMQNATEIILHWKREILVDEKASLMPLEAIKHDQKSQAELIISSY